MEGGYSKVSLRYLTNLHAVGVFDMKLSTGSTCNFQYTSVYACFSRPPMCNNTVLFKKCSRNVFRTMNMEVLFDFS